MSDSKLNVSPNQLLFGEGQKTWTLGLRGHNSHYSLTRKKQASQVVNPWRKPSTISSEVYTLALQGGAHRVIWDS